MNKRLVFMGTPAFAVASLNALVDAGLQVVAVVTAPDRPAGRGRQLRASAVKERAVELSLPVLQPTNLKDPAFHAELDRLDAALFVVVAFRMLPEVVWARPAKGTINLHASLLPNYRGAAPINWAIINGEAHTGVTTFLINDKIDTGDILLRRTVDILPADDAGTLHDRLMATGADLLLQTVHELLDDASAATPQQQLLPEVLHDAPKLTPDNCRVDWNKPANRIHDLIRGLSPYPAAWTQWSEAGKAPRKLKILKTQVAGLDHKGSTVGKVVIEGDHLLVHCGTGILEVLSLQMEGKRAMDTSAFLRGLQQHTDIILT